MMNSIVFKSQSDLDAERNIEDFIFFCREKLTVFGVDLQWDASIWKGVAVFSKIDKAKDDSFLDGNFIDFSKSYVRYMQALSPAKKTGAKIMALKCIEKALLQVCKNAHVYNVSTIVLDEALQIASNYYKNEVLYKCGYELERLACFLSENHFVKFGYLGWVNPIKLKNKNSYLPEKEDGNRKNKLPDEQALLAVANIFSQKDEVLSSRDLFTTSVCALLMCSPSRVSEILALPADCEITRKDKNGVGRYGLRYYAAKGGGATIKWIPDVMVPVAKKAISRLRVLSDNARSLARWYECSPGKFYRHSLCPNVNENEPLDAIQVCHALGYLLSDKKQCINKVKRISLDGGISFLNPADGHYTLRTLWKMITGLLPEDFPWFNKEKSVKYSNALCLLNLNQLNESKLENSYVLYKPTYALFYNDICKSKKSVSGMKSIFERYNYFDDSGEAFYLRSHQPRHLLNTLAHLGDMSDLDIAKWSGRVSILQNRDYDHTSQEEMLEKIGLMRLGNHRYCNQKEEQSNTHDDVEEFVKPEHGAIHLTPHGYCMHNYLIPPCSKLTEAGSYITSDYDKMTMQERDEIIKKERTLHQLAKKAMDEGFYGADKWVSFHNNLLSALEKYTI